MFGIADGWRPSARAALGLQNAGEGWVIADYLRIGTYHPALYRCQVCRWTTSEVNCLAHQEEVCWLQTWLHRRHYGGSM